MLHLNQLIGLGASRSGGGVVTSSELFASSTSVFSTIVCPDSIQPDDVIVLFDRAQGAAPALVTPTNFISIIDDFTTDYRANLSYKVALGNEGGTTVTGMVGTVMNKVMVVFRPNGHPDVGVAGIVSLLSSGNPADLVIPASQASGPLVVVAAYGASDPIDPRAFTPAKLGEVNSAGTDDAWIAYKLYNSAPADVTIGMDDEGTLNQLFGCFIQFIPYVPGPRSFIINSLDEMLTRVQTTSIPNKTICTYSMWVKIISFGGALVECELWSVINVPTDSLFTACAIGDITGPSQIVEVWQDTVSTYRHQADPAADFVLNTWYHVVVRYDSTQAVAANRVRVYKDGVLISPNGSSTNPTLNLENQIFDNGFWHVIGSYINPGTSNPSGISGSKRLAFIDLVEGQSLAPTDFAFDNAGVWTRKPYIGGWGTHGHSLDGSAIFNDVSGNGRHFTGHNMTESANLSLDLPPWT